MLLDLSNILDQKKAKTYFNKLLIQNKKIELKEVKAIRSISINSYMHVCLNIYAIEFGYTLAETKTMLKRLCPFMRYEKNGQIFLKETHKMDNKEVSEFVEWVRNYASNNGLYILDAEEYKSNKYNIDKEISKHKQYL